MAEKGQRDENDTELTAEKSEKNVLVKNLMSIITPPSTASVSSIMIQQQPLITNTEQRLIIMPQPDESQEASGSSKFSEPIVHTSIFKYGAKLQQPPAPDTWINCVAPFAEFITNFEKRKIFKTVKDDKVPNSKLVIRKMSENQFKRGTPIFNFIRAFSTTT